ncbi:Juxtaposed with another zinc finger protein 1, variant 2 [Homalodisca vitripennis]|nr:Juxtaposed with another zinc finger protein 1, variant 2 [Homalodisca vitripennis]
MSELEDSNDSWTTPEEFSSEFILRYGSKMMTPSSPGPNGINLEKPFACPVPGCKKRYKNVNGIKYHSKNGHKHDGSWDNQLAWYFNGGWHATTGRAAFDDLTLLCLVVEDDMALKKNSWLDGGVAFCKHHWVRKGFKCHCGKSYKTSSGLKNHTAVVHSGANMTTITTQTGEVLQIPSSQVTTIQPVRALTLKHIASLGLPVKTLVVATKPLEKSPRAISPPPPPSLGVLTPATSPHSPLPSPSSSSPSSVGDPSINM